MSDPSDLKVSWEQAAQALQAALEKLHVPFDPETFGWKGVLAGEYKAHEGEVRGMGWKGIKRYGLGRPPIIPTQFALRYFEIEPGRLLQPRKASACASDCGAARAWEGIGGHAGV
jgi:hypothetical protein